jgi:hypothetical protein
LLGAVEACGASLFYLDLWLYGKALEEVMLKHIFQNAIQYIVERYNVGLGVDLRLPRSMDFFYVPPLDNFKKQDICKTLRQYRSNLTLFYNISHKSA